MALGRTADGLHCLVFSLARWLSVRPPQSVRQVPMSLQLKQISGVAVVTVVSIELCCIARCAAAGAAVVRRALGASQERSERTHASGQLLEAASLLDGGACLPGRSPPPLAAAPAHACARAFSAAGRRWPVFLLFWVPVTHIGSRRRALGSAAASAASAVSAAFITAAVARPGPGSREAAQMRLRDASTGAHSHSGHELRTGSFGSATFIHHLGALAPNEVKRSWR